MFEGFALLISITEEGPRFLIARWLAVVKIERHRIGVTPRWCLVRLFLTALFFNDLRIKQTRVKGNTLSRTSSWVLCIKWH